MTRIPCLVLLLACSLLPQAQASDQERASLTAQRKALAARYADEERDCARHFVVTACVDDVRARRRAAIAPFRERELQLDEADRRERATTRRAAIASKQAQAASRPAAPETPQLRVRQPVAPASAPARAPRPPPDAEARAVQAQERVQEAQQRRQEAQAAQQRIQRRQTDRQASGRKADPLPVPVPGAASQPGR